MGASIAAMQGGLMPHDIFQMTQSEIRPFIREIIKNKIDKLTMLLLIQHDPKKADEEINRMRRSIPTERKATVKKNISLAKIFRMSAVMK